MLKTCLICKEEKESVNFYPYKLIIRGKEVGNGELDCCDKCVSEDCISWNGKFPSLDIKKIRRCYREKLFREYEEKTKTLRKDWVNLETIAKNGIDRKTILRFTKIIGYKPLFVKEVLSNTCGKYYYTNKDACELINKIKTGRLLNRGVGKDKVENIAKLHPNLYSYEGKEYLFIPNDKNRKICFNCLIDKAASEFYSQGHQCKDCLNKKSLIRYDQYPMELKQKWIKNNKHKSKNRLLGSIRKRMRNAFKNLFDKNRRHYKTIQIIGCSGDYLKKHIESQFIEGMSWENYGPGYLKGADGICRPEKHWQIDHIIPLSSFDLDDFDEICKANHYTNLQPLWAEDNLKKSNNLTIDNLPNWEKRQKNKELLKNKFEDLLLKRMEEGIIKLAVLKQKNKNFREFECKKLGTNLEILSKHLENSAGGPLDWIKYKKDWELRYNPPPTLYFKSVRDLKKELTFKNFSVIKNSDSVI